MDRGSFFRFVGLAKTVDPILQEQYDREEAAYHSGEQDVNHRASTWNLSFHGSSFPAEPDRCPRLPIYSLMSIPSEKPFTRFSRAIMDAGEDIEDRIVTRFERAGVLVSGSGDQQTNFRVSKYWIVGHTDAIILPPGADSPHVVEIKSKKHEHVLEMQQGKREHDPKHYGQLLFYMFMTNRRHKALGFADAGLEPCTSGSILYVSRDSPSYTHEFYFDLDLDNVRTGIEQLERWRQAFLDGELPDRPDHFMWSKGECQWCEVKKLCKQDVKSKVTKFRDSCAIDYAKSVDQDYDIEKIVQRVIDHWAAPAKPKR